MNDFLANNMWILYIYMDYGNLEKDAVHKKGSSNHKSH